MYCVRMKHSKNIYMDPSIFLWSVLDVDGSSNSERLMMIVLNLETDLAFGTKNKDALLVSPPVTGDWSLLLSGMRDCLCFGWCGLYPWDPGGNVAAAIRRQNFPLTTIHHSTIFLSL